MLHAALTLAALEEAEPSKTAFYVAGGLLVLFAVVVAALGIVRHDFPASKGGVGAVVGIAGMLVVATVASAVLTA